MCFEVARYTSDVYSKIYFSYLGYLNIIIMKKQQVVYYYFDNDIDPSYPLGFKVQSTIG